jgi:hypothetical protein
LDGDTRETNRGGALAGARRLLAGRLQIAATRHGRIVFNGALELIAPHHRLTEEDKPVRNVAFSILLGALALLQVAVVAAELSHPAAQTAKTVPHEAGARYALASTAAQEFE